jgi:hypothetical protein
MRTATIAAELPTPLAGVAGGIPLPSDRLCYSASRLGERRFSRLDGVNVAKKSVLFFAPGTFVVAILP